MNNDSGFFAFAQADEGAGDAAVDRDGMAGAAGDAVGPRRDGQSQIGPAHLVETGADAGMMEVGAARPGGQQQRAAGRSQQRAAGKAGGQRGACIRHASPDIIPPRGISRIKI